MLWISLRPSSQQRGLNPVHLALTISITETMLTVSVHQRRLLIEKALRATSTVYDATYL